MSHEKGARIIHGALFDAREQARQIVEQARAQADEIRERARVQGMDVAHARLAEMKREFFERFPEACRTTGVLDHAPPERVGVVRDHVGLVVRARMNTDVRRGELVHILTADGRVPAEVVGFRERQAILLPLEASEAGIASGSRVVATGRPFSVLCTRRLLGRVLDGLGHPLDSGPSLDDVGEPWPVYRRALNPLTRPRIDTPLTTGVRAIDGLMTMGRGQRVGLFAGPGVGKSSLLGRIARTANVDVCVICLVGERGREVREFLDVRLGDHQSKARTIVVAATSDAPSLVRVHAARVATAIAEWFRERERAHVLLVVDSLTRLARAQREVGLAAGELPARYGYPPSVFALLPRLIERAGNAPHGSISALYTVLEASERIDDPVAEEARSMLDGHIVLNRERAARGMWPPIDVLASVSRVMDSLVQDEHRRAAARVRKLLAAYHDDADLVAMGAYRPGSKPDLDAALIAMAEIDDFLCHEHAEPYGPSIERLLQLARRY